jgi:serine/threonine protein phosphatase 1
MKTPLKTLKPNLLGKDYVIGDLHGSYSVFENLLANLNFNPLVDRLISVGDLIDRGAQSLKCLSLIREPWFHSVFANHEQLMLEKFNDQFYGQFWYQNGGFWGAEAYNSYKNPSLIMDEASAELIDLLPLVEQLPWLITVDTKSGNKFHIIHAELPETIEIITDKMLSDPNEVQRIGTIIQGDGESFLWNRSLYGDFYSADISNKDKVIRTMGYKNYDVFNKDLSHVISGHTILRTPMTILGQTCIDTGAYKSGHSTNGLTCVELDSWKFYKATNDTFEEVNPITITEKDMSGD